MKLDLKKLEKDMLSLTFAAVVLWGIVFLLLGLSVFFDFVTEFFAGLFGVLIAFLIEDKAQKHKENDDRDNLCRDIRDELYQIRESMENEHLFYPDIWDSAVASGQLRLLNSDQTRVLTNVYRDIRRIGYDSTRLEEFDEKIRLAEAKGQRGLVDDLSFQRSPIDARKKNRQKRLLIKLDNIMKEEWLSFSLGEKNDGK